MIDPTGGCTCPPVWNGVIPPECRIHNPAGRTFTTTGMAPGWVLSGTTPHDPEPKEYRDPPECRVDGCKSLPAWDVDTSERGEEYTDYVCGRHLLTFLWECVWRPGATATITRRKRR